MQGIHPTLPSSAWWQHVTHQGHARLCRFTCRAEAELQRHFPGPKDCQEAWLPAGNGGPGAPCLICAPQQHIGARRKEERLLLCEVVPRGRVACQRSAQQGVRAVNGSLKLPTGAKRVQKLAAESQLRSACMDMLVAEKGKP